MENTEHTANELRAELNSKTELELEKIKSAFYKGIKISPLEGDRYMLLEDFKYKDIIIPKGYKTNGANIPRIFWSFWPPNRSNYMPAVIVHDYLCDMEEYNKADKYFSEILLYLNVSRITAFLFYYSVKYYHKLKYGVK